MKKITHCPFLLVTNLIALFAIEPASPSRPAAIGMAPINIEANAGLGFVLAGGQVDFARGVLSPEPDYFSNLPFGARFMLMRGKFGFQAGYRRNLVRATRLTAGGSYSVYTYDTIDGGVNFALPISMSETRKGRGFLVFGAGLNYSMLQLADKFKSDLQAAANQQGVTLIFNRNDATGVGGYLQGTLLYYLHDNFFFSVGGRLNYVNAKFAGATNSLDSWGIEIPFGIGVGF